MRLSAELEQRLGLESRRYQGVIDGVLGGFLYGWCCLIDSNDPVELELFVDDQRITQICATEFRPDLRSAGYRNGNHGFQVDVRQLGLMPDVVIRIKVAKHAIELENSGRLLEEYGKSYQRP